MNWRRLLPLLVGIASVVGPKTAGASERSLLVVVETMPGLGLDGADVRRTISAELGTPVIALRDAAAETPSDLMIVALDRGEIRMSLREDLAAPVSRAIPMPAERAARLQAIAWLAGNLARDQVSVIVAGTAVPATVAASPVAASPVAASPPTEPPPLAPPAPPVVETVTVARTASRVSDGSPAWTVSVSAGPSVTYINDFVHLHDAIAGDGGPLYGSAYQIDLQRRSPGRLLLGAALDVGSGTTGSRSMIGVAPFIGAGWYRRHVFAEATAGLGLAAARIPVATSSTSESSAGTTAETTITSQFAPVLYGRLVGTLGVPLTESFDLLARLALHITTEGTPIVSIENQRTDYASLTLGVRLRLP